MYKAFRHILLLLVAVAFVGGTTTELARSAQFGLTASATGMPCDTMTMPTSAAGDAQPMQPCKGMAPDCNKLMGCITVDAAPVQFQTLASIVQYSVIDYWTPASVLTSSDLEPEPLPPRTT